MSGFEMLPRAKHGDPIYAEDWNALVAAIEGVMQSWTNGAQGFVRNRAGTFITPDRAPDSPSIIYILNTTGGMLNRFSVVGLGDLVDTPENAPDGFQEMPVLIGETPDEDDHTGKFAILMESIGDDSIGKAVIAGAIFCTIDVSDESHEFADVADGETGFLKSASSGMARIVWKEAGTGEVEAYVILGGGSGSIAKWGKLRVDATEWQSVLVDVWTGLPGVVGGENEETETEESVQGQMPGMSLPADARVLLVPTNGFPSETPYQIQPLECPEEEEEEP